MHTGAAYQGSGASASGGAAAGYGALPWAPCPVVKYWLTAGTLRDGAALIRSEAQPDVMIGIARLHLGDRTGCARVAPAHRYAYVAWYGPGERVC